jgi:hypothetical protein
MGTPTTAGILGLISDEKSMNLFRTISQSVNGIDSDSLKDNSKLTRKEYYTRLARMTNADLVIKRDGRYVLTAFGKIVFDAQLIIDSAIANLWGLKAIDSLEMSNEIPKEEQKKLVNTILHNQEIKEMVEKKL